MLHKETPTRLVIYPVSRELQQIADIVGNGLSVPQSAKAQLVEAMERTHIPAYRAVGEAMARLKPAAPSPQLDDLRGLQAGVLELMTLEVGKARGSLDPAQADRRAEVVSAQLAELSQRMRARNGAAPD